MTPPFDLSDHLRPGEEPVWAGDSDPELEKKGNKLFFWFALLLLIPGFAWKLYEGLRTVVPAILDGRIFQHWWILPLTLLGLAFTFWFLNFVITNINTNPSITKARIIVLTNMRVLSFGWDHLPVAEIDLSVIRNVSVGPYEDARYSLRITSGKSAMTERLVVWLPYLKDPNEARERIELARSSDAGARK